MLRANPTNRDAEMCSYYAYHAPEHGNPVTPTAKQDMSDDGKESFGPSPNLSLDLKPCFLTSTQNPEAIAPLLSPGLVSSTNSSFHQEETNDRSSRTAKKSLSAVFERVSDQETEHGELDTPHSLRPFAGPGREGSPVQRFIDIADTVDTLKSAHDLSISMGPLPMESFHVPRLGTPSVSLIPPTPEPTSKRRRLDFPEGLGLDVQRRFEEMVDENIRQKERITYLVTHMRRLESQRDHFDLQERDEKIEKLESELVGTRDSNKKLQFEAEQLKFQNDNLKDDLQRLKQSHDKEINETDLRYQTALKDKDRYYESRLKALTNEWEARLEKELHDIQVKDALEFEQLRMRWEDDQQSEFRHLQLLHEDELRKAIEKHEKDANECAELLNQIAEMQKMMQLQKEQLGELIEKQDEVNEENVNWRLKADQLEKEISTFKANSAAQVLEREREVTETYEKVVYELTEKLTVQRETLGTCQEELEALGEQLSTDRLMFEGELAAQKALLERKDKELAATVEEYRMQVKALEVAVNKIEELEQRVSEEQVKCDTVNGYLQKIKEVFTQLGCSENVDLESGLKALQVKCENLDGKVIEYRQNYEVLDAELRKLSESKVKELNKCKEETVELRYQVERKAVELNEMENEMELLRATARAQLEQQTKLFQEAKEEYLAVLEREKENAMGRQKAEHELAEVRRQYEHEIGQLRAELMGISARVSRSVPTSPSRDDQVSKLSKALEESESRVAALNAKLERCAVEWEEQQLNTLKTIRQEFEKKVEQLEELAIKTEAEQQRVEDEIQAERNRVEREVTEKFSEEIATLAAKHTVEKVTLELEVNHLNEEIARMRNNKEEDQDRPTEESTDETAAPSGCSCGVEADSLKQMLHLKELELDQLENLHQDALRATQKSHEDALAKLTESTMTNTAEKYDQLVGDLKTRIEELNEQLSQSQQVASWQLGQPRHPLKRQGADSSYVEDIETSVGVSFPEPLEVVRGVKNHHARLENLYQDLRRQLSQLPTPVPSSVCKTTDILHTALEAAFQEVEDETASLQQQLDAADKQLKSIRQFLADQAEDREAEREEQQNKIARLETQLMEKDKDKTESLKLVHEVEALERQLQQRSEICKDATDNTIRLERALKLANDKIADLNGIVVGAEKRFAAKQRTEFELREEVKILKHTLVEQGKLQQELNDQLEFMRQTNGDRPRPDGAASNFGSDRSDSPQVRAMDAEPAHLLQELRDLIEGLIERVDRKTRDLEAYHAPGTDSDTSRAVSPLTEDVSVKDRFERRDFTSGDELRSPTPFDFLPAKPLEDLSRLNAKLEQLSKIEEVTIKRVRDSEMQLKAAKDAEKHLREECEGLRNELRGKEKELKASEEKYERLRCYDMELRSERDELQAEFSVKEKLVASLEMRIAAMEPAISSLGSFEELKAKLQDAQSRQEELEYSLEQNELKIKDLTKLLEESRQSLTAKESELIKVRKEKSILESEKPFTSTPISVIARPSPNLDLKLAQKDAEIEVLKHDLSELKDELNTHKKLSFDRNVSVEELRDAPARHELVEMTRMELQHSAIAEKSTESLDFGSPQKVQPASVRLVAQDSLEAFESSEALRDAVKELQWKLERKEEQCEYSEKECDLLRETVHDLQTEGREAMKKLGDQDRLISALQASKKTLLDDLARMKSSRQSSADEETSKRVQSLQTDCDDLVRLRDSLMSQLDSLKALLFEKEQETNVALKERDLVTRRASEIAETVANLQHDLKEEHAINDELHRQLEEAQEMAVDLQRSLEEANKRLKHDSDSATEQLNKEKRELELQLENKIEQLNKEKRELELQLENKIEQLNKEKRELELQLENVIALNSELHKEKSELEEFISKLECENDGLRINSDSIKHEYAKNVTDFTTVNSKYKVLLDQYETLNARYKSSSDDAGKLSGENRLLALKCSSKDDDLRILREKNAFLSGDVVSLKLAVSEVTDENASLKDELRELKYRMENDAMKASVDDLFGRVEDELDQTECYDRSVLAYVDNLNSPNLLPTPDWSCDEGVAGNHASTPRRQRNNSILDAHNIQERELAKKVRNEGMKVLALSEDLYVRQQGLSSMCSACRGDLNGSVVEQLLEKTVVRPESPTLWRTKAMSLERQVERLTTELKVERVISENQQKSNENAQHHLLSVVGVLNKERSNASQSCEEVATLRSQIEGLKLELLSSNEEIRSIRCLLASESSTDSSEISSASKTDHESMRRMLKKLNSQCTRLKCDRETLITTVRSLNSKIASLQEMRTCLRCEEMAYQEIRQTAAVPLTEPPKMKELLSKLVSRALKAESCSKALVYQKRYLEKVIEAQRGEITIRNMSDYSDIKRRSFRVVALTVRSCIRMRFILQLRKSRRAKLSETLLPQEVTQ